MEKKHHVSLVFFSAFGQPEAQPQDFRLLVTIQDVSRLSLRLTEGGEKTQGELVFSGHANLDRLLSGHVGNGPSEVP